MILDQFEEYFLYASRRGEKVRRELARCVTARDLRANFLISIREDAYSRLGDRFGAHPERLRQLPASRLSRRECRSGRGP